MRRILWSVIHERIRLSRVTCLNKIEMTWKSNNKLNTKAKDIFKGVDAQTNYVGGTHIH